MPARLGLDDLTLLGRDTVIVHTEITAAGSQCGQRRDAPSRSQGSSLHRRPWGPLLSPLVTPVSLGLLGLLGPLGLGEADQRARAHVVGRHRQACGIS